MFKHAIVRKPCKSFQYGITKSNLGKPNYEKSILQHSEYVRALKTCKVSVIELEPDEKYPDSTFVEDTAIVDKKFAIINNLGTKSRKGEEQIIKEVLKNFYDNLEIITYPGTLEGGDVMKVEDHYFIGLSKRTNLEGAKQFIEILGKYDYCYSIIPLKIFLHLKTGTAYLGNNCLILSGELIDNEDFKKYKIIKVNEDEAYAANCIKLNDYVIMPKGFDTLKEKVSKYGYKIIEVEMSEFRKMDGGISCLSLRF